MGSNMHVSSILCLFVTVAAVHCESCSLESALSAAIHKCELKLVGSPYDAECGKDLDQEEAVNEPNVMWPEAQSERYYTLVMVDPNGGNWAHFVRSNIPGSKLVAGTIKTEGDNDLVYNGPTPPRGSGYHHYQIIAFDQGEEEKQLSGVPNSDARSGFSLNNFAGTNGLCDTLVAAYEYITKTD